MINAKAEIFLVANFNFIKDGMQIFGSYNIKLNNKKYFLSSTSIFEAILLLILVDKLKKLSVLT